MKYCKNCKTELADDMMFCHKCGSQEFEAEAAAEEVVSEPEAEVTESVSADETVEEIAAEAAPEKKKFKMPPKKVWIPILAVLLVGVLVGGYFAFFFCYHEYILTTIGSTCTVEGERTYRCDKCGYEYTEKLPIDGSAHKYKPQTTKAKTCTEDGVLTYTCEYCGDSYTETIAKGHSWKRATCISPKTCLLCGATEGEKGTYHAWSAATCKKPKTCGLCGKTEGTKAAHTYYNGKCTQCGAADPSQKISTQSGSGSTGSYNSGTSSGSYTDTTPGSYADTTPKRPTIVVDNSLPCEYTRYGYKNAVDKKVMINNVSFEYYYGDESECTYKVCFEGKCTYNSKGDNISDNMVVGWKLYDESDFVIDSGTFYSSDVAVGESFRDKKVYIYHLKPGKTYRFVLSDVV